jgi:hypothetical protein
MKKLVITTAMSLGLLASSYAQGFFNLDNSANYTGDTSAAGIITIGAAGAAGEGSVGAVVGSGSAPNYSVGYLWLLGTTLSGQSLSVATFLGDGAAYGAQTLTSATLPASNPAIGSFFAATGDAVDAGGLYGNGAISPATTGLPDGQNITVQIVAWYNPTGTGTFAAALANGTINVGWSTLETIRLAAGQDQTVANTTAIPGFTVQPVPEPTTLALAGLGGLSLLLLRRKQS